MWSVFLLSMFYDLQFVMLFCFNSFCLNISYCGSLNIVVSFGPCLILLRLLFYVFCYMLPTPLLRAAHFVGEKIKSLVRHLSVNSTFWLSFKSPPCTQDVKVSRKPCFDFKYITSH